MKRFAAVLGGAVAALALVVPPALAGGKAAVPNYLPGNHVDVAMYVDTIESPTTSSLGYTTTRPGAQNNFVAPKQAVTFRMWAVDTGTGKVLTANDVRQAYVKIPNQPNVLMTFAKQGTKATSPWYWTGVWTVPADYKLGRVDFAVLLRTKVGSKLGAFSQDTLADTSRLTITATP